MAVPNPNKKTDNVIVLSVIDGKLSKKPSVRYNKDGSVDKRHSNRVNGVSSTVYPFNIEEIKIIIRHMGAIYLIIILNIFFCLNLPFNCTSSEI